MKLLSKATNCCGGCFKVEVKFTSDEMRELGVTYTEVDRMGDKDLLNKICDMMTRLGLGSQMLVVKDKDFVPLHYFTFREMANVLRMLGDR